MNGKKILALCILSAIFGSASTVAFYHWNSPAKLDRFENAQGKDKIQLFPGNSSIPNLPDPEEWESAFFQQFLGNQPTFFVSSPTIQTREDDNYVYFELPLKENEESKLKANVVGENLEIEGEIQERTTEEGGKSERFVQRSFSHLLPLPLAADPKTLMVISEPGKTVIRFQKKTGS